MGQRTAAADQLVVERELVAGTDGRRDSDRVVFAEHGVTAATVTRTSGHGARLYVTTDGSAPSSRGPWRWVLSAGDAPASLTVPLPPGADTVRVHADADCSYSVQPL